MFKYSAYVYMHYCVVLTRVGCRDGRGKERKRERGGREGEGQKKRDGRWEEEREERGCVVTGRGKE